VGDSRVYRCDARGLVRLTEDHSEVNEAVRQGWMTAEQAEVHPRRNVISRAIGADSEVEPEIIEIEVDETTTLLLCSDGITRHIRDEQLERLLRSGHHPQSICETMKQLCYEAGAEDNLTAIVVDFGERGYIDEQTRPAVRSNSEAATADKPRKKIEIVLNEPEPEAQPAQEAESQKVEEVPAEAPVEKPAPASASPMPEPPSVPQRTRKQREINIAPTKEVEQKVEMSKFMRMSVLIVTLLAGFILGGLFGGPLQQLVNRAGGPLAEEQPRVLRWTPKDAGVAAAYAQFQQGRPENAQKELNDILARSPNNPDAHFCFGRIYFAQKEYHEAIKHFEVAVNNDPELDEAWVFIALAYLQSGTPNRNAADSLQKLITPNAPSPQATSSSASPKPSATPAG
jgi:TolA-binding protein